MVSRAFLNLIWWYCKPKSVCVCVCVCVHKLHMDDQDDIAEKG